MKKKYYCYLLVSKRCPGHTYIGYTTDPDRRLAQHNGKVQGGAKYTKRYRPWKRKILVSGFKSSHDALMFEWAWKHPSKTRFLKGKKDRISYSHKNNRSSWTWDKRQSGVVQIIAICLVICFS